MVKSTEDPFESEADRLLKKEFELQDPFIVPKDFKPEQPSKSRYKSESSNALVPYNSNTGGKTVVRSNRLAMVNRSSEMGLIIAPKNTKEGWATYQEISQLVDATLLKKQKLDQLENKFSDKLAELPYFYVKMLSVADRVYQHSAWTVFNYNSELYHLRAVTERLFKVIELVEDARVLKELVASLSDCRIENALKIRLLNHLISVGAPVQEGNVKIKLDENIFEMIYHKIEENLGSPDELLGVLQEMDRLLLGLFRSNYDSSVGEELRAIFEKTGASNPVFKTNKEKTVTYLAKSEVDLKHFGDYLVIVLASFILFDCGEFLSLYLAMERDAEFIVKIVSRIGERSCDLVLRKIDPGYQSHLFEKLGGLLFFKSWALIPDIVRILRSILTAPQLEVDQKVVFFSNSLRYLGQQSKYSGHVDDFLGILLEVGSPELLAGVRNLLKTDPIYEKVSQYVQTKLREKSGLAPRERILVSLLIVEETLRLLNNDCEINCDQDDLDSLPNLLKTSQAMVGQQEFLITDGGEILTLDGNRIKDEVEREEDDESVEDLDLCRDRSSIQITDFNRKIRNINFSRKIKSNTVVYELPELSD